MDAHRGRVKRIVVASLLLGAAPLLSGCSLAFVKGPSSTDSEAPPECTRSPVAPILDFAYVAGTGALAVATDRACSGGRCESIAPLFVGVAVVAAIPVAVSAIVGTKRAYECSDAWHRWCASRGGCSSGDTIKRPHDWVIAEVASGPDAGPLGRERRATTAWRSP